jgi:hypothetical protein
MLAVVMPLVPQTAYAASATEAILRLDRMAVSTTTGGTVCWKTATVATEATVVVTFPTGYTVNGTTSNWPTTVTNLPPDPATGTAATAWPSIGSTASSVAGQVVTFASGDLTANTFYCFNFGDATHFPVTNPGSPASSQQANIVTNTSTPTQIDIGKVALAVIANDQVTVTATVPPIFTFSLLSNTDSFPTDLSTSAVTVSTGVNIQVGTNAKGGWTIWIKDANQGLRSSTTLHTIPTVVGGTAQTLTTGQEHYGIDGTIASNPGGGSGGVCTAATTAPYNGNLTTTAGQAFAAYQQLAACTNGVSSTNDQVTMQELATIASNTPAGSDYSDIITVVGAGNF